MNQALIDQYVSGHLGEQEAEEFETYCLTHPDFARQVEAEQLLKAGVAHVARATPRELDAPRQASWRWPVALAATLVAACGIALYSWGPGAASTSAPVLLAATAPDKPTSSRVLRLAMIRGAAGAAVLPAGRARVEIAAMFEPDVDYTLTLMRVGQSSAAERIATLEHQHASSSVAMPLLIDGDHLAPGAYTLRVQRADSADEPLDFMFVREP